MLMGDCPLTFSLDTSGPSTALIHWGAGRLLPVLPPWGCLVPQRGWARPPERNSVLLFCCVAYAAAGARAREHGPPQGIECHLCPLLPSLCRQQKLGSPEGRTTLCGGDPRGEGPGCLGLVPLNWVST